MGCLRLFLLATNPLDFGVRGPFLQVNLCFHDQERGFQTGVDRPLPQFVVPNERDGVETESALLVFFPYIVF